MEPTQMQWRRRYVEETFYAKTCNHCNHHYFVGETCQHCDSSSLKVSRKTVALLMGFALTACDGPADPATRKHCMVLKWSI